jgi:hypothetical protein
MTRINSDYQGVPPATGWKPPEYHELHITQHTMQASDPVGKFASDVRDDLDRKPDIYVIGEMNKYRNKLREVAENREYSVGYNPNINEAFLVKQGGHVKIQNYAYLKVLDQFGKPGDDAYYPAQYISWVKVNFHGRMVFVHTQEWLRGLRRHSSFPKAFDKQTKVMATQLRKHGNGMPVSFMVGDIEWSPSTKCATDVDAETRPDLLFAQYNCQDIYTELGVGKPSTTQQGDILNYAARYMLDTSTKALRFKVHGSANSNHRAISYWYNIDVNAYEGIDELVPDEPVGNFDPYPYGSAGNINYDDYLDDTSYYIEVVTEDSDYLRS